MIDTVLPVIWAGIIAFGVFMYVVLDGFTLGTGILIFRLNDQERDQAYSMLLPNWDGNQTWLVLGGATLYGAFPQAFSIILPVLYLPLLLMVIALLFRGVAFEFRLKSKDNISKRRWDLCFMGGSLIATFVQGLVLGGFIEGFHASKIGTSFSWLSPYSMATALALIFGYALLGATRLILKTEGSIDSKMRRTSKQLALIILAIAFLMSLWTPFVDPTIFHRWFRHDRIWLLVSMPSLMLAAWLYLWYALEGGKEHAPFWASVLIFICCYLGFAIGIWPYIVPYELSIWQAAAPSNSLLFMMVGAAIMLPVLLIYTAYSYKIFGGKVKDVISY